MVNVDLRIIMGYVLINVVVNMVIVVHLMIIVVMSNWGFGLKITRSTQRA